MSLQGAGSGVQLRGQVSSASHEVTAALRPCTSCLIRARCSQPAFLPENESPPPTREVSGTGREGTPPPLTVGVPACRECACCVTAFSLRSCHPRAFSSLSGGRKGPGQAFGAVPGTPSPRAVHGAAGECSFFVSFANSTWRQENAKTIEFVFLF